MLSISGSLAVYEMLLELTPGIPEGVSIQWLRDGIDIPGETSYQYSFANSDMGHDITFRVTFTDTA